MGQKNLQLGKNRDKRCELVAAGSTPTSSSEDFFLILWRKHELPSIPGINICAVFCVRIL